MKYLKGLFLLPWPTKYNATVLTLLQSSHMRPLLVFNGCNPGRSYTHVKQLCGLVC